MRRLFKRGVLILLAGSAAAIFVAVGIDRYQNVFGDISPITEFMHPSWAASQRAFANIHKSRYVGMSISQLVALMGSPPDDSDAAGVELRGVGRLRPGEVVLWWRVDTDRKVGFKVRNGRVTDSLTSSPVAKSRLIDLWPTGLLVENPQLPPDEMQRSGQ